MNKKGFTLVEILFALTIVGIIAAISITGLRANISQHEEDAFSKKALHTYSSAIYEVMNAPTAPDNFVCAYALEYISQGTITGSTSTTEYTTGDGVQFSCSGNDTVTITFPNSIGSCQIVTNSAGVVQGGTCGDLNTNNLPEETSSSSTSSTSSTSSGSISPNVSQTSSSSGQSRPSSTSSSGAIAP